MAKQAQTLFLEEWLRNNSNGTSNSRSNSSRPYPSSSARAIILAWAELRESLQHQSFQSNNLQSLQTLLNSQTSLHVADPQAKLLLSILSSPTLSPPHESYPLFLRVLYIWVRKSSKPNSSLIDSAVSVLSRLFSIQFDVAKYSSIVCEGILLLGAISLVPILSQSSKRVCLELLCRLLEEEYRAIGTSDELVPKVLAGIGYALSSSENVYFSGILNSLFGIWNKEGRPHSSVPCGLMILHLIEWVVSSFIKSWSLEKVEFLCREVSAAHKPNYAPFAAVMAAAGVLRAFNRSVSSVNRLEINPGLRNSIEGSIERVAKDLISSTGGFVNLSSDSNHRLLLQCISLGLARSGPVSFRAPLLSCLISALLIEIFPLRSFYKHVVEYPNGNSVQLGFKDVKEHLDSVLFKEAGAITSAFCSQYVSADEENKVVVENLIWGYCQDILYSGHRQVALMLRDENKELLGDLEKIAEAAFLMVVVFASAVTKYRLNSKFARENHLEISVRILVSFSCTEYFRRVRLPEYTDVIRGVIVSVQENESACVSFIESMPSYADLVHQQGSSCLGKVAHIWSKDVVQTARILFCLRVIPTCVERVPSSIFRKLAPTMFLYMGYPNGKVSRASHSVFVAFISTGKESNQEERVLLMEQLVFYYIQRALEAYPAITPFEGMASGVAALVRHLPAGSPAIFYSIHCLIEKASSLCSQGMTQDANIWKNWEGDLEPCKKVLELLLRLLFLVDIQVLPNLMKPLAQLIVQLPQDGQNMVLDEMYSQVAESNDVTRKPTLISWLRSLSYVCSQGIGSSSATIKERKGEDSKASAWSANALSLNGFSARL